MKLVWTAPAWADRIAIYEYIEADNAWAAAELDDQFVKVAEYLKEHPEMGHMGRVSGTRELHAHQHYVLVYAFDGSVVEMLALVHTSRQWP